MSRCCASIIKQNNICNPILFFSHFLLFSTCYSSHDCNYTISYNEHGGQFGEAKKSIFLPLNSFEKNEGFRLDDGEESPAPVAGEGVLLGEFGDPEESRPFKECLGGGVGRPLPAPTGAGLATCCCC